MANVPVKQMQNSNAKVLAVASAVGIGYYRVLSPQRDKRSRIPETGAQFTEARKLARRGSGYRGLSPSTCGVTTRAWKTLKLTHYDIENTRSACCMAVSGKEGMGCYGVLYARSSCSTITLWQQQPGNLASPSQGNCSSLL